MSTSSKGSGIRTQLNVIIEVLGELQEASAKVNEAPIEGKNAMVVPQPHHYDRVRGALNKIAESLGT